MHIAYYALRTKQKNGKAELNNQHLAERYQAYQTACNKYRAEIAAIQQYMPGWMPPFERKA
ncbi:MULTISPECIES: hypothetical protein [unclassified Mucilaginibacter]|uniref:hypothetical protein n=1 Tax=unclassified Mucilaginibacter TaxID=2617802 RepID=UPI002AC99F08|nr:MULTISPECIES: hypothetical protein [unclassified Mucilaginibacter]MEB0249928.1 hypothetical protein [Mucilaginibacter sp. 5B2]MEB0262636.1 hypothetical protein [Mucilaginibacter sp. 10I4]MEB0280588.1 hypothetical protein [Mucilaginibacter sp. 10B2]MEB0300786.1 hypothetical protein [Mucilaginibacter sp. 5C4]WPX24994.1 hypothetical protein RHM67_06925 [Mucilaginibacter sp. 5C4]